MNEAEALSWAIFCIKDYLHPEDSEASDLEEFEGKAETVIVELTRLRNRLS